MERLGLSETSIHKYWVTLRNIPEERRPQFECTSSVKCSFGIRKVISCLKIHLSLLRVLLRRRRVSSDGGSILRRKEKFSEIRPLCQHKPTRTGPQSNLAGVDFTAWTSYKQYTRFSSGFTVNKRVSNTQNWRLDPCIATAAPPLNKTALCQQSA
jgi:hypothetical protein